ncbi:hypothetical protein CAPTEDRAFT_203458 [Capitella teleta]|uniref:Uncharacterized protein n=1 Tax=Capitella teleta TaxID=283909 RepID=R7TKH9_CAPTE|nr:hypothetical protein CAPTEDRAFT_203458 [Capitella teleta]|eukprot:ELT94214.1 hypothetical protein CAPTEDRAFT_203458 [Capitella teleta]
MGLKSDWWRAVNRIAMDYNLDGVYYMLKYRRLSAEGKRLARIPDEWVEEMAKEKVEGKVKHRELEKWRGKLKGTERKRRYAEETKDLRMEREDVRPEGVCIRRHYNRNKNKNMNNDITVHDNNGIDEVQNPIRKTLYYNYGWYKYI